MMRILQCPICGCEFETAASNVKYCPGCRKKPKKVPVKVSKGLADILRELDEYNRTHGTFLSYGKWVLMNEESGRRKK